MRITVPLLPTEAYNTHIQVFHNDLPVANCRAAGGLESCTVAIPDKLDPSYCLILVNLIDNFGNCVGPIYQLIDDVLSPYDPNAPQQADWSDQMESEPEEDESGSTLDVSSENTVGAELSDEVSQTDGNTINITDEALGYVDSEDDVNG